MIDIKNKADCCGCTACVNICPKKAIKMKRDVLGFEYPVVDKEKCISCGLCDKVCSFKNGYTVASNYSPPVAYATRHKKMCEIEASRSGAAFIAFSDIILQRGGSVYGAAFDSNFVVKHQRAITPIERDSFRGSKYVQSSLGDTFKLVKEDLAKGLIVLFSGTAGQVAGVKKFIPASLQKKLYTIDIVCHGVPSPFIFADFLKYTEKKFNQKIVKFNFRDKSVYGWSDHCETIVFADGQKILSREYKHLFYKNIILRESCYRCPFANLSRVGEITLGDFWGWENVDDAFNKDDKGCSLVLINNSKGRELFDSATDNLISIESPIEKCLQRNLRHPTPRASDRDYLEKGYARHGFDFVVKNYIKPTLISKIKKKIARYGTILFKKKLGLVCF